MIGNFIYTNNSHTKLMLEKQGFKLFKASDNLWVFINNKENKFNFSKLDGIVLSNKLTF